MTDRVRTSIQMICLGLLVVAVIQITSYESVQAEWARSLFSVIGLVAAVTILVVSVWPKKDRP